MKQIVAALSVCFVSLAAPLAVAYSGGAFDGKPPALLNAAHVRPQVRVSSPAPVPTATPRQNPVARRPRPKPVAKPAHVQACELHALSMGAAPGRPFVLFCR